MPWSMLYVYCYRYNNLLINEYLCSFDNDMKSAMETFFSPLPLYNKKKLRGEAAKIFSFVVCFIQLYYFIAYK